MLSNISQPQASQKQETSPLENAAKILGIGVQLAGAANAYNQTGINQQNADTARMQAQNMQAQNNMMPNPAMPQGPHFDYSKP